MSRTAIILSVVAIAVLGFIGFTVVRSTSKAPPVSGAGRGPASGSGVIAPKAYGTKATNTAANLLSLGERGLNIFGQLKHHKVWGTN